MIKGIKNRLTDRTWYYAIKKSRELYKKDPCPFYKNQIRLNIKSFLGIKPSYGYLCCEKVSSIVSTAYHITEKKNLSSIRKEGLHNSKSNIVFLLRNDGQDAKNLIANHKIKEPVLLQIDVAQMQKDGISVFFDSSRAYGLCTAFVPYNYITEKEI